MTLAAETYRRATLRLIVSRLLLAVLLVAGAILIGWRQAAIAPLQPLIRTGAVILAFTVVWLALWRPLGHRTGFAFAQLAVDALTVSALMILTGGADSIFVVLQFTVLLAGALLLDQRWALRLLAVVIALYGALIIAVDRGWPPLLRLVHGNLDALTPAELYNLMLLHLTGFVLVSVMGSRLARRVRLADLALASAERTFADYRAFSDALVGGITDALLAVSRAGTVVFANEEALARLGAVLGRPAAELLPELDFPDLARRVESYGSTTLDLPPSGAREVAYEARAFPLAGEGMPGYALILRDVTNFRRLQAELKFRENLAAMGEVSARIAHEIRNPLAAISASAQLLRERSPEPDAQQLMGVIVGEAERLSAILGDFLRYTRPEAIHPEPGDLAALVRETAALAAAQSGARIRAESPARPLVGAFDPARLRQVLWNLISNARKAAPPDGEILLELVLEGDRAVLAVEDDGPGVPPEKREKIFTPLFRDFSEGSGLGLAIARKIAEGHGGTLELRPPRRAPRGARFELALPGFRHPPGAAGAG